MIRVIHLADDGTEVAAIEVDDFTIEVIYSGIADMLRAAANDGPSVAAPDELPRDERQRREKILTRVRCLRPNSNSTSTPTSTDSRPARRQPIAEPSGWVTNAWAFGERARRYAEASCPPIWRTSSPPIEPAPPTTTAPWLTWSNAPRQRRSPRTSPRR